MTQLAEITPKDVMDLTLDVNLELTKYRGEQEAMQTQSAMVAATQFYMLPVPVQMRLANLTRQQLKAYQIKDVEEIIVPFTPEEQMMMMPPAPATPSAGAPADATPPPSLPL